MRHIYFSIKATSPLRPHAHILRSCHSSSYHRRRGIWSTSIMPVLTQRIYLEDAHENNQCFFFYSSTFTQYLWACTQHNFGRGKQYHYHFESVTHREKTVPLRSWTREILWPKRRLSITVKSIFISVTCLICLSWTGKWVQMKKS